MKCNISTAKIFKLPLDFLPVLKHVRVHVCCFIEKVTAWNLSTAVLLIKGNRVKTELIISGCLNLYLWECDKLFLLKSSINVSTTFYSSPQIQNITQSSATALSIPKPFSLSLHQYTVFILWLPNYLNFTFLLSLCLYYSIMNLIQSRQWFICTCVYFWD